MVAFWLQCLFKQQQMLISLCYSTLDDDILFGARYFENMFRVVDEGFSATRNGRFLGQNWSEYDWRGCFEKGHVDTFDEDNEYDFGGHIWAGRIFWLQAAFRTPPLLLPSIIPVRRLLAERCLEK